MRARVRSKTISIVATLFVISTGGHAQEAKPTRPTNRLAKESSPYLLQHAHNPVDWHAWGPEAFARAKVEQKPIFLSVGYSTCYWCHVMERESFENEEIAKYLNEHFICVKVDREERPDVDQIYMAAVQAFQGRGGWPMTVFCTPDGRPFFGGTYYPSTERPGMESFPGLARRVVEAWRDHRTELDRDADTVTALIRRITVEGAAARKVALTKRVLEQGLTALAEQFDPDYGGFGFDPAVMKRPKFPEPTNLIFLLTQHARGGRVRSLIAEDAPEASPSALTMLEQTLDRMSRGGIRDHLGGGYHRYSTDRAWAVPHFEKMLYDNALLAMTFAHAFEVTKNVRWRREAEGIFECVARDFTSGDGAFFSALDAEVDGAEGASYAWTRDEVERVLGKGDDTDLFALVYGLTAPANFENGSHVLLLPRPLHDLAKDQEGADKLEKQLEPLRRKLLEARAARKQPRRDEKILTAWNGLMIAAYADAARIFSNADYRATAERAAEFLWTRLRGPDGQLLRTYRAAGAPLPGYLEDYAFAAWGFLQLQEATNDPVWLNRTRTLADRMIEQFADGEAGGFFYTDGTEGSLIARTKDFSDGALPSGNAVALLVLIKLYEHTKDSRYFEQGRRALESFSGAIAQSPAASPTMLQAVGLFFDAGGAIGAGQGDPAEQDPLGIGTSKSLVTAKLLDEAPLEGVGGEILETRLRLSIADGWHIYANPVGSETLKPTVVTLVENTVATLESVDYPPGRKQVLGGAAEPVNVYEKDLEIPLRIRLKPDAKSGEAKLQIRTNYQACDDRACLAPAAVDLPILVRVRVCEK